MKLRLVTALFAAIVLLLTATHASAQKKLFRWVDDDGVVHYGDRVPPEYANRDRDVLNEQAVTVGFQQGEITEEERRAMELEAEREAENARQREQAARRDRMLLDTYLTVADIEDLRDRRLELIESQIRVTEFYLSNLRRRLSGLEKDSERFAPLSEREDALPLPEYLALDISRARASIVLYEQTLERVRIEQQNLREAFADDIERFKQLKGG